MIRPLLFSLMLITTLFAQEVPAPKASSPLVTSLQTLLDNGNYDAVVEKATDHLKSKSRDTDGDFVAMALMEAYVQQKEYQRFARTKKGFLKKFSQSPQLARVYYLSGITLANHQEYTTALVEFDKGFSALSITGTDPDQSELIAKTYEKLTAVYVSKDELLTLQKSAKSTQAQAILTQYLETTPSDQEDSERGRKRKNDKEEVRGIAPIIAILAPITGDYSALGESAVNTAELALEAFQNKTGQEFRLKVIDTKGSALEVARQMTQLYQDSVALVVGPIMSNTATVAAAMLMEHPNMIMVTPTATDDGIAGLGPNIYQLNLTPKALATKIATYAMSSLHITHFTILAPISEYGEAMAHHFQAAVEANQGTIDIVQKFSVKSHDHRKQFVAIRESFADQKFGATDTLENITAQMRKDRAKFMEDSTISLGGIFIPATVDNVITIAAEIPFHKLQGQLLGVNSWETKKLIQKGGSGVQNSFIASQERVDRQGEKWVSFSKTYNERYNSKPHKLVAPLVFDAFQILLEAYSGSTTVEEISAKINTTHEYQGLSGSISLDGEDGVNSHAKIMKVSGDTFIRIQ